MFEKNENYIDFIKENIIIGGIFIEKKCKYVFDLKNHKWNFFKNGVEYGYVNLTDVTKHDNVYTLTYESNALPPNEKTIITQVFTIDIEKSDFISSYSDPKNKWIKVDVPVKQEIYIN